MAGTVINALWYSADYAGCGFLRTVFPNLILNSYYGNQNDFRYSGIVSDKLMLDGNFLKGHQIVHFQRQITPYQLHYLVELNNSRRNGQIQNLGLIYDVDDLLTEIPDFNYCRPAYDPVDCTNKLKTIFQSVDIFTTSTEYLKLKMQAIKGNSLTGCSFLVVPNLIPKFLYYKETERKKNDKPKIVWAGSQTHFSKDNLGDLGVIYELVKRTQDEFDWVFMGGAYPEVFKTIKATFTGWTNLWSYPRALRNVGADFGIAPLVNHEFNRSKSNIKLLEYSACDYVTISSDLEPYRAESSLFIQPTWQETKDLIIETFTNKEKYEELINKQREMLKLYWLEDNVNRVYGNMMGLDTRPLPY